MGPSILFLGSGGARFVVARQLRASGGMWMYFGETQIHVDPGPGALLRALNHVPPCNPRELDAIVLSHKHLDHSSDVNAMIEAMTSGGFRRRGTVLAPADAFDSEPVVLPYARRFVERIERLEASSGPYPCKRTVCTSCTTGYAYRTCRAASISMDSLRIMPSIARTYSSSTCCVTAIRWTSIILPGRMRAASLRMCVRKWPSFNTSGRRCSRPIRRLSRSSWKMSSVCERLRHTTDLGSI
jgi:ribonuclease BN (tRNA processing enzyme)